MSFIHAVCCYNSTFIFVNHNRERTCASYQAWSINGEYSCITFICGNGKPSESCGVGPCNIWHCNCYDGCIPGNAKENFERIHGDDIEVVEPDLFASA